MIKYKNEEYVFVESLRYNGVFKIINIESGFREGYALLTLQAECETINFFCHQVRYATLAEIKKSKLEKMYN
jgi:hypothetical protein